MKFKVEVQTDSSGKWYSNAITYPTKAEATVGGADLVRRWTAVREWRVVRVEEGGTDASD